MPAEIRIAVSDEGTMFHHISSGLRDWALACLRLTTAFLFWQHGAQKLFGWFESEPAEVLALRWFAGVLEFLGPVFIGLGLFTRPVAFLLSGEMAFAYFMFHHPRGFWPVLNGGERAVLFCFIYLLLAASGPGRLALDNLLFSESEETGARGASGRNRV